MFRLICIITLTMLRSEAAPPMMPQVGRPRQRPRPPVVQCSPIRIAPRRAWEATMRGYRALLVGAGGMGRHWGENLRDCERVELAGWVDIRPGAAAAAAEGLGLRVAHTGED